LRVLGRQSGLCSQKIRISSKVWRGCQGAVAREVTCVFCSSQRLAMLCSWKHISIWFSHSVWKKLFVYLSVSSKKKLSIGSHTRFRQHWVVKDSLWLPCSSYRIKSAKNLNSTRIWPHLRAER
jgi:hypothetical protein